MMLAKSLQSAAGNAAGEANYIEDVFSAYLYTGNGSTQTITNGIDLAGEGGLVWSKRRSTAESHVLLDTARNNGSSALYSDATSGQQTAGNFIQSFNSNGYSIGTNSLFNASGSTNVSWTFRKQPKFFDVVTYTGNGTTSRTIAHNLGSVPGCIIVKRTDASSNWAVYHRSIGATNALILQGTNAQFSSDWFGVTPTSSNFYLSDSDTAVNANGGTYVAYLFAHNAGGFGLSGEDNVISCGSFTTTAGGLLTAPIELGYEPQWVMYKRTNDTSSWSIVDTMRGFINGSSDLQLQANNSNAEASAGFGTPTATGIANDGAVSGFFGSSTYIYIAIRRGPMKVPESGTEVFKPLSETGTGAARTVDAGFPVDTFFIKDRTGLTGPTAGGNVFYDRLRGNSNVLQTQSTDAEAVSGTYTALFNSTQNGVVVGSAWSSYGYREYCFRRAPGFFDVVCYTGTGVDGRTVNHNLTVTPELMIVKLRSAGTDNWFVYSAALGATKALYLNGINAAATSPGFWNDTAPTASVFSTYSAFTNQSGQTYVAYLFASVPGVSKCGSYTGTGTTQQINCGFSAGARFVLIKRTDSTGDWYVWDSARGIVAGNDPYLLLNSTAAEVTTTDYVDTYSAGFEISSTAPAAINASGGTFVFLAIA